MQCAVFVRLIDRSHSMIAFELKRQKHLHPRALFTLARVLGELRGTARVAAVRVVWETPKLAYTSEISD